MYTQMLQTHELKDLCFSERTTLKIAVKRDLSKERERVGLRDWIQIAYLSSWTFNWKCEGVSWQVGVTN